LVPRTEKPAIKQEESLVPFNFLILAWLLMAWLAMPCPALASERPPNVVLIFTDDQGYQDIGCFGSPNIRTPHLDRMAREGRKFTSFYSACSVCSPSRAALMTGCYPPRVGVTRVLFAQDSSGLHPDEITLAEILKNAGYRTVCIGKWHLGHKPPFLPTRQGFDSWYGIPYSNDMRIDPQMQLSSSIRLREGMTIKRIRETPISQHKDRLVPLMRNEEVIEYPADQSTLTKRYTQEAVRFITETSEAPFFLYLPHTMPHIPLDVSEEFRGRSEAGLYGDTIQEIDWSVGQILQTLQETGRDDNTLVIFTSDNGPWNLKNGHGGSAQPLRGYKFDTYEGGMRVPCLMRWPGRIPAGTQSDEIAATIDLLPTIAALAGVPVPTDRVIDGHDIRELMTGEAASTPHDAYFYYKGKRVSAVRRGCWKLRITPARPKQEIPEKIELFDLVSDISESRNLADMMPDKIAALRDLAGQFDRQLRKNSRPAGKIE
jgi:arylsulfatase A-like enzyme